MFDSFIGFLRNRNVEYCEYVSLSALSSIKIGGLARVIVYPKDEKELLYVIKCAENLKINYRVVGNMTNLLPPDGEYSGALIRTERINGFTVSGEAVTVGCGCSFKMLAARLLFRGLGGAEELFMIPGSVGAMCCINAGAHGKEIADIFVEGRFLNPSDGRIFVFDKTDMRFDYRDSAAKRCGYIMLSATLEFKEISIEKSKQKIQMLAEERRRKQPTDKPSLGSFYKRRNGIGIGFYIDRAGLKGKSVGGASVSEKHAGFIINAGDATASDVLKLDKIIKSRINEKYGFVPEWEIEPL